jgi:hypothetical protein
MTDNPGALDDLGLVSDKGIAPGPFESDLVHYHLNDHWQRIPLQSGGATSFPVRPTHYSILFFAS